MRTVLVATLALVLGLSLSARGETTAPPLADRVPGDAIVYLGWAGTDALSSKYDASHLRNVLDGSDLPAFLDEFFPQLITRVEKQDQNAAEILKQVVEIGAPMWKHPSAVYFGGIDWTGGQPLPKLAVLCDAGADAPALADRISKLLAQAPQGQGPLPSVKTFGGLVVLAFGTPASIDADFAHSGAPLAKSAKFIADLGEVQHDPAFAAYIDVDALVKAVDEGLAKANDAQTVDRWQHARDALGLPGLHGGIMTAGFDGKDWLEEGFVSAGPGNQELQSLLRGTPLSQEIFAAIPKNADRVAAGKFDLDGFVGHVLEIVRHLDAGTADQVDQAMSQVNQIAGLDVRKDFLATLGDEWAYYSDRSIAGPGLLGSVVVNRLKNPDAFENAVKQLSQQANQMIASQIKDPSVKVEFRDSVVDGVTLHFLAVPLVTPCWAVKDGNLYLGLYPQVVSAAAAQVSKHSPSILQNPAFTAVMTRLGNHPASSVEFANLPALAPDSYSDLLMASRLYLGFADVFGIHVPTMVVPPLAKIMPELAPSGSETWSDASGMFMKSVSPFPGSAVMSASSFGSSSVAYDSLLVSILLPSLNRARETANRAKCASNEHQIGLAILLYSNDNNGKLPDDLGTLVKTEQISPAVFICPSGNRSVPPNMGTMTPDQQAKWVNDNTDYIYLGKGQNENRIPATQIVVYEKETDHGHDGMNLLYGDGHVEWQTLANALPRIQLQTNN